MTLAKGSISHIAQARWHEVCVPERVSFRDGELCLVIQEYQIVCFLSLARSKVGSCVYIYVCWINSEGTSSPLELNSWCVTRLSDAVRQGLLKSVDGSILLFLFFCFSFSFFFEKKKSLCVFIYFIEIFIAVAGKLLVFKIFL